jgi:hypothetical protein
MSREPESMHDQEEREREGGDRIWRSGQNDLIL